MEDLMRTPAALTIVGLLIAGTTAQADLALLPPDSSPTSKAAAPSPPNAAAADQRPAPRKAPRAHLHDPATPTARGFGTHIPLSFAVRQIVPTPIKVSYGRSANQAALVDWHGGRKWTLVLRDAVRPLGLHLKIHKANVLIGE
jgi:hypothetical protein